MLLPSLADAFFVGLFVVLALGYSDRLLADGDTGYHVRTGEHIIATGQVPTRDLFAFDDPPLPWFAHEWLAEVVMALAHRAAGLTGVVVLAALLLALALTLLFRQLLASGGDVVSAFAIAALAATTSMLHWLARPHLFTLLGFSSALVILQRHRHDGWRGIWLLPLLMVAWVNLHGGFVTLFLLLGIELVDAAIDWLRERPLAAGPVRRRLRALLAVAAACLLATLVNPRGGRALWFPLQLAANRFVVDHVDEFQSPDFHHQLLLGGCIAVLLLLLLVSRARLGLVATLQVGLFFVMALYSSRHAPLFALVAAPAMVTLLGALPGRRIPGLLARSRAHSESLLAQSRQSIGHLWPLAALLGVVVLIGSGRFELRYQERDRPIAAVQYLLEHPVAGRPYTNDEFGDYLIYAAWPRYRVFFDGRGDMYGADRMRDYLELSQVGPRFDQVVAHYDFDWAFVRSDSTLAGYLALRDDWHSIYSDALAAIFVRDGGGR